MSERLKKIMGVLTFLGVMLLCVKEFRVVNKVKHMYGSVTGAEHMKGGKKGKRHMMQGVKARMQGAKMKESTEEEK